MPREIDWSHRACCATSAASGRVYGFTEPSGASPVLATIGSPVLVENLPRPARTPRLAFHEAGHAVVATALGAEVDGAKIGGSDSVTYRFPDGAPGSAVAGSLLAGEVAERWRDGAVWGTVDGDLTWLHRRCRNLDLGNCDKCRAMLHIVAEDQTRCETAVIARWREIEIQIITAIQRLDVWISLARIADVLLEHGEIDAHEINALVQCKPITLI